MKIKYKTNLKGYITVLRSISLLLKDNTLDLSLLGAYLLFVMQADWDKKHDNYTMIIRDDKQLASEWGCSQSTVNRKRNQLIKMGLLKVENGITQVTNFSMFVPEWTKTYAKLPAETTKSLYSLTIDQVAKEISSLADMHKNQDQKSIQSFNVPSKENITLSSSNNKNIEDSYEDIDPDEIPF